MIRNGDNITVVEFSGNSIGVGVGEVNEKTCLFLSNIQGDYKTGESLPFPGNISELDNPILMFFDNYESIDVVINQLIFLKENML